MLDKSIPYYNVIMLREGGTSIPRAVLPGGFAFEMYTAGKECSWAEIETSVGEFDHVPDALTYFQREYVPHAKELERRVMFVKTSEGRDAATITGWWNYTGERRDPAIHWVSVRPEYQGLGVGKALVFEGLRRLLQLEGDRDVYLHTQTWSYRAIGIYRQAGFRLLEKGTFGGYVNEYEKALPVLHEKCRLM